MATDSQVTLACQCGAGIENVATFLDVDLGRCEACGRFWITDLETGNQRLLVPFNAFPSPRSERDKREDRYFCPRCGGEAEFNDRNFRADCKDSLCGLSWNYYPSMISPAESDINLEERVAKKRFGRAEISEEEFLKSLIRLREKREALKATIL